MSDRYRVASHQDGIRIEGPERQDIDLRAKPFFDTLRKLPPPRCLDLLHISAGIYVVDRLARRRRGLNNEAGHRRLRVTFDVRDLGFWTDAEVSRLLVSILEFLTCDEIAADFQPVEIGEGRPYQSYLDFPPRFRADRVTLYSGGLDSAAGLANLLLQESGNFLLVTVGHQRQIANRVDKQIFGTDGEGGLLSLIPEARLEHASMRLEMRKSKRLSKQERTQRSRAFLFCVSGAIAAHAHGAGRIEMLENGVGAINLPLMSGMLDSPLATRSSHPTFLRLMSTLCSRVAGEALSFTLPFLHHTKGEMLAQLCRPGFGAWLQSTLSCTHGVRQKGKSHCGSCPACIERRQAFAVAGIDENIDAYVCDILREAPKPADYDYFQLYRYDAQRWLAREPEVLRRMQQHLRLTDIPSKARRAVCALQTRHAREVLSVFGPPFSQCGSIRIAS